MPIIKDDKLIGYIFNKIYGFDCLDLATFSDKVREIRESVYKLKNSFKGEGTNVCYNESDICKAYMLSYFPAHVRPAEDIMCQFIIDKLKFINTLNLTYFAAGADSEIYGTMRALANRNICDNVNLQVFDINKSWNEIHQITFEICDKLIPINFFDFHADCDIMRPCQNCSGYNNCIKNIFSVTDIYFVQNYISHATSVNKFVNKLRHFISHSKKDSLFVIIDLNYDIVKEAFERITDNKFLEENGVYLVKKYTPVEGEPISAKMTFSIPPILEKYIFTGENFAFTAKRFMNYYYVILCKKTDSVKPNIKLNSIFERLKDKLNSIKNF